jgi:O-antigen/teichoic acid export membrane protein
MSQSNTGLLAKLAQGSGLLLLANLLSKSLSILILPLLTALLPPELYGEAALVGTMVSLASVLALAGMDVSYARAYFGVQGVSSDSVEKIIWQRGFWHSLIAGSVMAIIWVLYSRLHPELHPQLAPLIAFAVFGTLFSALAQVRARLLGHYQRIAIGVVLASLLAYVLMMFFATHNTLSAYALVTGSVVLVWVTGLSLPLPNLSKIIRVDAAIDTESTYRILSVGLPVMLTAPAYWVLSASDRWFLSMSNTTADIGVYAIGVSFGTLGMMLNSAVLSAWVPEVIREYETHANESYQAIGQAKQLLVLAYALVWMLIAGFCPELIRLLVDARYFSAISVVPWIAGGVFFYGCAHLFNTVFLLERRLTTTAKIWLVAVLFSLAANAWAVPRYGMIGAAAVQCFAFACVAIMQAGFSYRLRKIGVFTPTLLLWLAVIISVGVALHNWDATGSWLILTMKLVLFSAVVLSVFLYVLRSGLLKKHMP